MDVGAFLLGAVQDESVYVVCVLNVGVSESSRSSLRRRSVMNI